MGIFSEAVDVMYSAQGEPAQLVWRGTVYDVAPHPLCWYERRAWWERDERLPPGTGVGAVDTQIWRMVLSDGTAQPFSLDVAHYRPAGRWRVIKIYDPEDAVFAEDPADGDPGGAVDAGGDFGLDPGEGLDGA
ncbi:hypothetical protein JOF48_003149 [Arthrobacter stackebrandtii]|uniref:DUF6504 domain-containing protein n=1 Tax=Arthrobacter stackebrandtii TaxID=272161 RepID=A0ABS4Z0V1_9MICC|nr:DUF6504 family protein [Arthrobacter stackebrandtii]MBP2414350.1 hypothetical protein [Arthrobacter stackebrandtii]